MSDCPTCGFPMVWSEDNEGYWCSVYGYHRERFKGRNVVLGARHDGGVVLVDFTRKELAS